MRVHILSDLHLEFAGHEPRPVDADVVIMAGDIGAGVRGLEWILERYRDRPVVYVLGNHEFYNGDISALGPEIMKLAEGTNVRVLENGRADIGGAVFLGASLWTDFGLFGNAPLASVTAQTNMADYFRIRADSGPRPLRPDDTLRLHRASLAWLRRELAATRSRRTVVVTHHAPSARSIPPRYRRDPLSAAFASDLDGLVAASGACLWVHGHIHTASDYRVGDCRIVANPRGYPGELDTGFDPELVVDL